MKLCVIETDRIKCDGDSAAGDGEIETPQLKFYLTHLAPEVRLPASLGNQDVVVEARDSSVKVLQLSEFTVAD